MSAYLLYAVLMVVPFEFHGTMNVTGGIDTTWGGVQMRPGLYGRWAFHPTFTLYGMPIKMDFYFSTEDNKLRQRINTFSISLNPEQLLLEYIKVPKFILAFKNIGIGNVTPIHSPYTLQGIGVKGFAFQFTPWKFFIAYADGEVARPTPCSSGRPAVFERKLRSVRLGVGKTAAAHFHFLYLEGADDPNSVPKCQDSSSISYPYNNKVVGFDANLSLFKKRLNTSVQLFASVTNNLASAPIDREYVEQVPDFLYNWVQPHFDIKVGVAGELKSNYKYRTGDVSMSYKFISPGYNTFGNPSLKADREGIEIKVAQRIGRELSVRGHLSQYTSNVFNVDKTTYYDQRIGIGINLHKPEVPVVVFNINAAFRLGKKGGKTISYSHVQAFSMSFNHTVPTTNPAVLGLTYTYNGSVSQRPYNKPTSYSHAGIFSMTKRLFDRFYLTNMLTITEYYVAASGHTTIFSLEVANSYKVRKNFTIDSRVNLSKQNEIKVIETGVASVIKMGKYGTLAFNIGGKRYVNSKKLSNFKLTTTYSLNW